MGGRVKKGERELKKILFVIPNDIKGAINEGVKNPCEKVEKESKK